jgi:putative ATPase
MAKMDLPPEFVFEYQGKENTLSAQSFERPVKVDTASSEETEPDDAARGEEFSRSPSDQEKLKRKVTFANEPSLPEGEDSEDEADEDEQQRYMKMRYKRSASLPSIELNRELARKIRRMLKEEEKTEDDVLHRQLTDLKLSQELDKSGSEVKYEYEFAHGHVLQVRLGDITEEYADIIVNEANSNLSHTSGIAAVLAQKGGKEIQVQSDRWVRKHGPVSPGQVAVTEAGQLPCKWLIHAVGPIWRGGNWREDSELWDSMWNCLVWATKLHAQSIAIPAVGATMLGFQKERCAYLLVDCIAKFVAKHPTSKLREIRIVNLTEEVTDAVVFEVVGKFTAGCDTSESERDGSSDYEDDEEGEEEVEDFVDDETKEEGGNTNPAPPPSTSPIPMQPAAIAPKWLPTWRRQSIA